MERRVSNNEWSRRSQPVSCRPRAARAWRFVVADSAGLAAFLVSQGFGWLWMARAMSPIVENGLEVAYVATGGALAALCSWLVADALSGLIHRAADTWGSVGWPVVGPLLLRPFREHHVQPLTILDHGFLERSGQNGLLAACPTSFWLLGVSENGRLELFLGAFVLLLGLWIMATNEIHAWAHAQEAPRLVRWLQRRGLVLSPEQHWLHHSGHHDSHYCITSGFWDRLWDRASAMAERPRARRRL